MTDQPASWLSDPTGRHDHRYWDGTQWTDHVADAGVAASDPYDGPSDAAPQAAEAAEAATTESEPSTSGWATTPSEAEVPAAAQPSSPGPSGWGAPTHPADGPAPVADATEETDTPDLFAPPIVSGWGASEPSTPESTDAPAAVDEPTPAPTPWAAPTWGAPAPSDAEADTEAATEGDREPDVATDTEPATAVTTTTPTWGDPTTSTPPSTAWSAPATEPAEADGSAGGGSRKGLVLVLALLAIVGIVVALVLVGDDDDVSSDDADRYASQIADQLQDQGSVSDEDAKCVGEYVVDEIGASRLKGVNLSSSEAPPELEADFQDAVQDAFTECDVNLRSGTSTEGTDGAVNPATAGTDSSATDEASQMTEQQYVDYYTSALGLSKEKAECLAERSADAVASGETAQDEATTKFYEWLTECNISLEELQQSAAGAGSSGTG